ncbi:HlyD family efflux transporter periplasmic adaptor subunit [Chitinophaga sp. MM2321]|uniref:efflux RND transporter periplasmic adaptor subunit n=1 Tax=Chitinophaga sp. MM2321 TaxID=3137178 RepID=UPI0032D59276
MDKSIEAEVTARRNKKRYLTAFLVAVVLIGGIGLLRSFFKSSLAKSAITTAIVERGNVENTITATGLVLPEFEEIITSPINASIQKVLLDAGSEVKTGVSVIVLDKAATQLAYENLKFQLESKRNNIKKLKLELDKSFYDLQSNNDIKQLRINSLEAAVENARRLYKAGGGTREDIERAVMDLKVAQLEKKQLENEITSKQQTMQVEMRESEIAAQIQQNDLRELERKLQQADIVASRSGVVTWVNKNIGAAIREGDPLVHIADLGSFKVTGSISDNYIDQLHSGLTAIVRINETQLRGTVVTVYPSIQNGIVSFDIQLNERNNKLLRPNMKVDVYLVTSTHNNVMRVANGPAFKGAGVQDIFVLNNGKGERRTVHIGMSNFDYVELMDHVKPGDVVITSDMSAYKNVKEIVINK